MRFLDQDEDNPQALYRLLRELGAPAHCYVIRGDGEYHELVLYPRTPSTPTG